MFYSRGARFALFQAWLGAAAISFDKLATLNSSPMVFSGGAYLVVAVTTFIYSKISGRWNKADKRFFGSVIAIGLLVGVYTVLVNAGYYFSLAANVGSLKRLQIFFTAVLAWLILREKHGPLRVTGSIIIFLGAILIALGKN